MAEKLGRISLNTFQKRKAAGLCYRCGQRPPVDGRVSCAACIEITREKSKQQRETVKKTSLCSKCGKRDPMEGRKMCQFCLDQAKSYITPEKSKQRNHERYWKNPEKHRTYSRIYREQLSEIVYAHYGARCVCCGETTRVFLTIDHVNNDGAAHRKQISKAQVSLFRYIIDNNYPDTFQVLCRNCNWAKFANGVCPHQEGKG